MNRFNGHSFHIPVMGIGYSIDTPVKVAQYGITSVVSLLDDMLMEKMREFYSIKFNLPFQHITDKVKDFRAKRITSYLNTLDTIVKAKFEELKNSISQTGEDIEKYFAMLPDTSELKEKFDHMKQHANIKELKIWIKSNLFPGEIDVNIMTKLDRPNYIAKEKLPVEYNDAHAALRGFANSNLTSSIVLSAGINPRLYSYLDQFNDFFPDINGNIRKRIVIKVSDYRSAFVQGKFLASKGIWVSEFRVESGLNCGGHAFATQGHLIGPILEDFNEHRQTLSDTLFEITKKALTAKGRVCPESAPKMKVTAQGGVGTAGEHQFLLNHYQLDSIGWGTPFLLVPEAVNVDSDTLEMLCNAKESDLYLSNISPMGVPFNSIKGNTKDKEQEERIKKDKPGSPCVKNYCLMNTEFTEIPICTASRQYQRKKIASIRETISDPKERKRQEDLVTDKSCICVGLGTTALLVNNLNITLEGPGVSICPGPNMAYFDKISTLQEMTDHIYGRTNLISRTDRPHMFNKELHIFIDFLEEKCTTPGHAYDAKQNEYYLGFMNNLFDGIIYYQKLLSEKNASGLENASAMHQDLETQKNRLEKIKTSFSMLSHFSA